MPFWRNALLDLLTMGCAKSGTAREGERHMPLFDAYVMVDWSGGNGRRGGKQDCIWIAHGYATAREPTTVSPYSRTQAEQMLRSLIQAVVARNNRILVCADFAYGYPAGFASLLPQATGDAVPPWRRVWQYLKQRLQDDLSTRPGRKPSNCSNRFEVASAINAAVAGAASDGPFWCLFKPGSHAGVPQLQPAQPFACSTGKIAALRITDRRAASDTPFRLFGNGSVGSQVLTGLPRLESLRGDLELEACSAVWPFETGWAPAIGPWLDSGLRVLHAEIYPSVRPPLPDPIKDRGQVRAIWHWARDLDAKGLLGHEFAIPNDVASGSRDDFLIRAEEGWILGCPR
jgi:precorrin-8X/cobalt-precorrin-8 methylmutase